MELSRRLELVASPLFGAAVLVLLVNDHVLKSAWPGLVTGKLSDVAGVVMVAIAAAAVLGRPVPAALATGAAFTLLKTVPAVASLLAPVLGGTTRTDPTDLVALVALAPLLRWLRHRDEPGPARRPLRSWALPAVFVPAAVFATTATSCDTEGVSAEPGVRHPPGTRAARFS